MSETFKVVVTGDVRCSADPPGTSTADAIRFRLQSHGWQGVTVTPMDDAQDKGAWDKDPWQAGYLIAVTTMLHQHGCGVTAEDALRDAGITLADCKRLKLDDFDMKLLRPILANMARRDCHAKARGDTK